MGGLLMNKFTVILAAILLFWLFGGSTFIFKNPAIVIFMVIGIILVLVMGGKK